MLQHKEFEFGKFRIKDRETLEQYLLMVWKDRFCNLYEDDDLQEPQKRANFQGILSFDGDLARAKNFIGFIQSDHDKIEIFPKVFRHFEMTNENLRLFTRHLFFWFSYCRKWRFPITKNSLDQDLNYDLPELLINIMADRIREVIVQSPISLYEDLEEGLSIPRGQINFPRYISNSLSKGKHYILECDTEPLQFDNKLNRALKYVTRLLISRARFLETREKLNDIIFILDEVEDIPCSRSQLDSIKVNTFYSDYEDLIQICKTVLDNQVYSNKHYEQTQWCLLFPMEYIFEDFITGFLQSEFYKEWIIEPQKSNKYLTDQSIFIMRHDIYLTNRTYKNVHIIIDTKYKLRSPEERRNAKKGVAQNDLYQMASYALRRGCKIVLLIYPNYSKPLQEDDFFTISSEFEGRDTISILCVEVPFWSMNDFLKIRYALKERLELVFEKCLSFNKDSSSLLN